MYVNFKSIDETNRKIPKTSLGYITLMTIITFLMLPVVRIIHTSTFQRLLGGFFLVGRSENYKCFSLETITVD